MQLVLVSADPGCGNPLGCAHFPLHLLSAGCFSILSVTLNGRYLDADRALIVPDLVLKCSNVTSPSQDAPYILLKYLSRGFDAL